MSGKKDNNNIPKRRVWFADQVDPACVEHGGGIQKPCLVEVYSPQQLDQLGRAELTHYPSKMVLPGSAEAGRRSTDVLEGEITIDEVLEEEVGFNVWPLAPIAAHAFISPDEPPLFILNEFKSSVIVKMKPYYPTTDSIDDKFTQILINVIKTQLTQSKSAVAQYVGFTMPTIVQALQGVMTIVRPRPEKKIETELNFIMISIRALLQSLSVKLKCVDDSSLLEKMLRDHFEHYTDAHNDYESFVYAHHAFCKGNFFSTAWWTYDNEKNESLGAQSAQEAITALLTKYASKLSYADSKALKSQYLTKFRKLPCRPNSLDEVLNTMQRELRGRYGEPPPQRFYLGSLGQTSRRRGPVRRRTDGEDPAAKLSCKCIIC